MDGEMEILHSLQLQQHELLAFIIVFSYMIDKCNLNK